MINERVVVDGSNIATEGRTLPSLSQLDDAVQAFQQEFPDAEVITVVVDATFGHRIDESERPAYEEGVLAGELVSPPAGAIGRGDAFVLSIANRADATVFSNDSFQEFHGQYEWLFDEGRLIGGKPVPGVGWVFVLRAPVRGPLSRRSTRGTRTTRAEKSAPAKAGPPTAAPTVEPPKATRARRSRKAASKAAARDTASAVDDTTAPTGDGGAGDPTSTSGRSRPSRRRRGAKAKATAKGVEPINEPMPYLAFVSAHPPGSTVTGTVLRFSSHGAYVVVEDAQCYLPLRLMADPPPTSAKQVLTVGDTRSFVVESFDSPRRSIDLAIPGHETVDVTSASLDASSAEHTPPAQEAPSMAAPRKAAARKTAAKKAPAKKKAAARKAPAKRTAAKKTTARKTAAKKTTARKAPAKKRAAKKTAARKTAAKKTTARKAPAKKRAAKKTAAKRR